MTWEIDWYVCRADADDVKARTAKKVGQELWRVAKSIGPLTVDHNHWARDHISADIEDIYLAAAAPDLKAALVDLLEKYRCLVNRGQTFEDYDEDILVARAAIAKSEAPK